MTAVLNALRLGSKPIRAIDPPVFIVVQPVLRRLLF